MAGGELILILPGMRRANNVEDVEEAVSGGQGEECKVQWSPQRRTPPTDWSELRRSKVHRLLVGQVVGAGRQQQAVVDGEEVDVLIKVDAF